MFAPPPLKEALFILKGGEYKESHPTDKQIMNNALEKEGESERFLEQIKCLYTLVAFVKFRKHLRWKKAFQLLVGSLMLLYIIFFVLSMVTNLSPGQAQSYEFLYLGFCGILIIFFILIIYLAYIEAKILRDCREPILQKIREVLQEHFSFCVFEVNLDRNLTIRVRPSTFTDVNNEADPMTMDYNDFISTHNPEGEDFYKGVNPYDFDPHEKNILADSIQKREELLLKEQNKANKLNRIRAKLKGNE